MGKNLIFPWLFQKIGLFLSYQNRKTMNCNSVRIGTSVYPNGMTSEQWNNHSQGTQLTGYADINPNTSVYPDNMTSEQWSEQVAETSNINQYFTGNTYKVNEDNVNRYLDSIDKMLNKLKHSGN